jgi:PleD family two-component response regulator
MKKDLKIFIADGDEYSSFVYKQLLKDLGYKHIFSMSDASSCITSMILAPDVVFLDYSISDFSGLEVLKKIKSINPSTHVILFSQIEHMNDSIEGLKFGAYDLILKGDLEEEHIALILENISIIERQKERKNANVFQRVASVFWSF